MPPRTPESPAARVLRICLLFLAVWAHPPDLGAQTPLEDAREALATGQTRRAVALLEDLVENAPGPDAQLYLGIALAGEGNRNRALDVLDEGATLYPGDSRFHDEIAGIHLARRNVDLAMEALERALETNPADAYATDLLASIRLSQGDVRAALDIWNARGQPEVDRITQNFAPGILDRTVPNALAFEPGDTLRFAAWETTETRLFASRLYSNVALELEPSPRDETFNVVVRTSAQGNARNDILFDLVRGLPRRTTYLDYWNIGTTGVSWRGAWRWDEERRMLRGRLYVPLPLPWLPVVELSDTWRNERWNLAGSVGEEFTSEAEFHYKVNSMAVSMEVTPHFRLAFSGGFEFRNRDATGTLDGLGMDDRNSGVFSLGTRIRPVEGRYRNQLRLEAFAARDSIIGEYDFHGMTAAVLNRIDLGESGRTVFDFAVSAGTLRGDAPVDHYFVLGLGDITPHELRGHEAADGGRYGQAPMGTDFVLVNTDVEHRLLTVPLFNALSIPYVHVNSMVFFDAARTFDRRRIFTQNVWYKDIGVGLKFETPTAAFTVLYGRDLVGNANTFYGYVEPTIW